MSEESKITIDSLKYAVPLGSTIGLLKVAPANIDSVFKIDEKKLNFDREAAGKRFLKQHVRKEQKDGQLTPVSDQDLSKLSNLETWNITQAIISNEDDHLQSHLNGPLGNPYISLANRVIDLRENLGLRVPKVHGKTKNSILVSKDMLKDINTKVADLKRATSNSRRNSSAQWNRYIQLNPNIKRALEETSIPSSYLKELTPRPPLVTHEQRTADATEASLKELEEVTHRIETMAQSMGELTSTVGQAVQEFMVNIEREKNDAQEAFAGAKLNLRIAVIALVISAVLPAAQMLIEYKKGVADAAREKQQDEITSKQLAALESIRDGQKSNFDVDTPQNFGLSEQNLQYTRPERGKLR